MTSGLPQAARVDERWLEVGETVCSPGADDHDRAEVRLVTEFRPPSVGEPRPDPDVEQGTLAVDALGLLEESPVAEHVQADGSVMLSALPDDAEAELLATFRQSWLDRVAELRRQGCSPGQAVDYLATEEYGLTQTDWADRCDASQSNVSGAVSQAREQLDASE